MTQTTQVPTRGEIIKQELATLAFITRGGNWLFLLLSRLAEPLMFLSVLYIIAETVLPSLFKAHMLLGISSACIIILNTAPEVILPGCFMQANQASEGQSWMYKAMGWVFIGLTFITLASFIWSFPVGAVSVILFFRCAAGVLYSLLVRMTPQRIDVMSTRQHQAQLDELTTSFNQQIQGLSKQLVGVQENLQRQHIASSTELTKSLQAQLALEITPLKENLACVPGLQTNLQHIANSTAEELQRMSRLIEKQAASETQKWTERPALRALPATRQSAPQVQPDGKFEARAFVFACLQENADLKLSEIEQRAQALGQELSQSSISRYRSQFFANSARSTTDDNASSTMQAVR